MSPNPPDRYTGGPPNEYKGQTLIQEPDPEGLRLIREALANQARRRHESTADNFKIRVDGVLICTLRSASSRVKIPLPQDADVIEVCASDPDGEVLLATHILSHSGEDNFAPTSGTVTVAARKFSFEVSVLRPSFAFLRGTRAVCKLSQHLVEDEARLPVAARTGPGPDWGEGKPSSLVPVWMLKHFEPAFEPPPDVKVALPLLSWRRRIAAMRVFHVLVLGSTAIQAILTLAGSVRGAGSLRGGNIVSAFVLLISMGIIGIRLWWISRYCGRAPVDPPSYVQEEITRRLRSLAGVRDVPVFFHTLLEGNRVSARVAKTRRGLHIFLNRNTPGVPGSAQSEALTCGMVWHEIGHYLQWDTTLGRWTLRVSRLMGWLSLLIGCFATLFMIVLVVYFLGTSKGTALPMAVVRPFIVTLSATAFMFAVFLGNRFWCRFSEYNSDQTAVIAGYGPEVAKLLESSRSRWISTFFGLYPSNTSRVDRIKRLLGGAPEHQTGSSANEPFAGPAGLKIRLSDYLYGGLIYVAPIFFGFELGARILSLLARHWLH